MHKADDVIYKLLLRVKTVVSFADCGLSALKSFRHYSIITVDSLLDDSHDPISKARLLAASSKESGVWLNVTPVTSLGLRLDNTAVRIAMGLCLGLQLCRPHTCQHCGQSLLHMALAVGKAQVVIFIMLN